MTTGIGSTASLWAFAILWGIEGGLSVQIFYALLVVSLIVGVAGAPDTRGKSLAQITKERYGEEI